MSHGQNLIQGFYRVLIKRATRLDIRSFDHGAYQDVNCVAWCCRVYCTSSRVGDRRLVLGLLLLSDKDLEPREGEPKQPKKGSWGLSGAIWAY